MKHSEISKILTSHIKNEINTSNVIKKLIGDDVPGIDSMNGSIQFNNNKNQYNEYIIRLLKILNEDYFKMVEYNMPEDNSDTNEEYNLKRFNKENNIDVKFVKELLKNNMSENDLNTTPTSEFNASEFIFSVENLPTFLNTNGILNKEAIRKYLRVMCEYYGLDLNIDEKVIDFIDENIKNFI